MQWMMKGAGGFPLFVCEAKGARFVDVDGHEVVDFGLGDAGAMTGHAPEPTVREARVDACTRSRRLRIWAAYRRVRMSPRWSTTQR
jgi:glutamate-1-semialdehyde aminotransferase